MKLFNWLFPVWLFHGLAFGGESSTATTTEQYDQRQVLGEGAVSAADGSTVSYTTIDQNLGGEVVDMALSFAGDAGSNALGVVRDSLAFGDNALNFAGDTFTTGASLVDRALDSSLNFAGDTFTTGASLVDRTVDNALNFAGDAGANALSVVNNSFAFGDNALNFAGDAFSGGLDFADRAASGAIAAAESSAAAAAQASSEAMIASANLADASMSYSAQTAMDANDTTRYALGITQDTFESALGFGRRAVDQGFATVSETNSFVKDAYSDAKGRGALTDKILIGALIAMAVVAVAATRKGL